VKYADYLVITNQLIYKRKSNQLKSAPDKDHLKSTGILVRHKIPKTGGRKMYYILKDDLKTCQIKMGRDKLFVFFYVINIIDLKLEDPIRQQIQYTGCTNIQIQ
jgi:hypothetical protein